MTKSKTLKKDGLCTRCNVEEQRSILRTSLTLQGYERVLQTESSLEAIKTL